MSKFTAALAAAKPSDAIKLPADVYEAKIVSATFTGGDNHIVRLDLETLQGRQSGTKFAGRRQIKNQPITEKAAGYVAALCTVTGNAEIIQNAALAEALERGDEAVLRRFVGKTIYVERSYAKDSDDVRMEIVVNE